MEIKIKDSKWIVVCVYRPSSPRYSQALIDRSPAKEVCFGFSWFCYGRKDG